MADACGTPSIKLLSMFENEFHLQLLIPEKGQEMTVNVVESELV